MSILLLALFSGPIATWGLVDFIIAIIIIAGAVGILLVVLGVAGVQIPPWVVKIFWIVVACAVGIFAIRLLASM
jgi:hypothetical protein